MNRKRSALCALLLILLTPLVLQARRVLPTDTRSLVAEKYAGWSGVLRLWVFEGWQPGAGSAAPWLNACAARFEKGHPGVYVQPEYVDAGAIRTLNDSGILPPDMILFPPGLMDAPAGLVPLEPPEALRPALAGCGAWGRATYAAPVAMGGYMWAWNPALTDGVEGSWRDKGVSPSVPDDEDWRHWGTALLALCAGRTVADAPEAVGDMPPGVDLGLASRETLAPTAPPADGAGDPCRLPEGFRRAADAWQRFINGEAAAIPVTQRELRRLQALSDRGRGPDWRISPGHAAFTDQLLCLGIVDRGEADPRRALCADFLSCLLEEESQGLLAHAGLFAVTDAPSGYEGGDPLAAMDGLLRDRGLAVPRCFGTGWQNSAREIVREFISGGGDPAVLWVRLRAALAENPNNNPQLPPP